MNKEIIEQIINEYKDSIIINLKVGYKTSILYEIESVCINGNCIQLNVNGDINE